MKAPSANRPENVGLRLDQQRETDPVMYALATFATRPRSHHDNSSSVATHTPSVVARRLYRQDA